MGENGGANSMCALECSLLVSDRGFIGDKVNGTLKDINECNNGVNYRQTLSKMTGREKQFFFSFAMYSRSSINI